MHTNGIEYKRRGASRTAIALGLLLLGAVATANAQAFSLLAYLFGGQQSSRLAKPYAVLRESFYPTSVVWSPDGRYIADTGLLTPRIHVWDMRTKQRIKTLTLNGRSYAYHAMAWSPDGRYLTVCANTDANMAGVWDTNSWRLVTKILMPPAGEQGCKSPAFSPDGKYLAIATLFNVYIYSTRNWSLVTNTDFKQLPRGYGFDIRQISFKPHTDELALGVSGYHTGDPIWGHARIILWNIHAPQPDIAHHPHRYSFIAYDNSALESLVYNPAGTQLATGTNCGARSVDMKTHRMLYVMSSVRIWNPQSHALLAAPFGRTEQGNGNINGLTYTADGRYLLSAHTGPKGKIDILDARTLKPVDVLYEHDVIGALAADPRASRFVATDDDKLLIWSIR